MKRVTIITPENIEISYRLAGAGSRMVAGFLDYFLQGALYLILLWMNIGIQSPLEYVQGQSTAMIAILLLVLALVNYGYFTVSEMVMNGQTIGKKVVGLKTIRKNGQPIDINHSLVRNFFRIFIDNYLIGIVMIFLKEDCGRLGDLLASTMVIENEQGELSKLYLDISKELKEKLTLEEIELLKAYVIDNEKITIGKKVLKEKLISYFIDKYRGFDEELITLIKKEIF
ncbi:MAG: RDD family protein [Thermotaleaceae bacterium]